MAATYNSTSYGTLAEALAARANDPAATKGSITLSGTTQVSAGGTLTIDQSVEILGANSTLNGVISITSPNVQLRNVQFTGPADSILVAANAPNITITGSTFNGGNQSAARAFEAGQTDFTFTNNTIDGFKFGSYINAGVTGTITGNTIKNSGNGFVVESANIDLANNRFENIDRSNISIGVPAGTVNLNSYFDGGNIFDNSGTIIGATLSSGVSTVTGTDQNDYVVGDAATSFSLNAGAGADTVTSSAGNDTFTLGSGNDVVMGTAAVLNGDTITDFAAGDRIVVTGATPNATVSYNNGVLTIDPDGPGANAATVTMNLQMQAAGTFAISNGEITFTPTPVTPPPGGGGGGGGGSPPVETQPGPDGSNTVTVNQPQTPEQLAQYATSGVDTVQSPFSVTLPAGIENVTLTGTNDVNATGNTGDNQINGNAGSNTLVGDGGPTAQAVQAAMFSSLAATTGGNDTLRGAGGNDVLYGNQGNDQLFGDSGSDTIYGGQDNDTVYGGSSTADAADSGDAVYGNKGNDVVYGNGGDDSLYGGEGNDTGFGGQGNDLMFGGDGNVSSVDGGDLLYGGVGNDTIYGNGGDDALFGNQDNDIIFGGQGNDFLHGGQGNDTLNGGAGNDTLNGGVGADRFVFATGGGNDRIEGFNFGEGDRLDLGGQSFTRSFTNGNTVLTLGDGGTITLVGIDANGQVF